LVSEALGPECNNNRTWRIDQYEIIEKNCVGFAGPHYYPVYLYNEKKKIDELPFIPDSTCIIKFIPQTDDTITFNICKEVFK
jgi:hypothetical protein